MEEVNQDSKKLQLPEIMAIVQIKTLAMLFILLMLVFSFFREAILYLTAPTVFIAYYVSVKTTKELDLTELPDVKRSASIPQIIAISIFIISVFFIDFALVYGIDWYIFGINDFEPSDGDYFGDSKKQFVYYCIFVGIVGPVLEEVVFRGVLLKGLYKFGPITAVLVQDLVFTLGHPPKALFNAFMVGILLGFCYLITGNILWGIVLHSFHNLMLCPLCVLLYTKLGIEVILIWFLIGLTLLIAFTCYSILRKDLLGLFRELFTDKINLKEEKNTIIDFFTHPLTFLFTVIFLFIPR